MKNRKIYRNGKKVGVIHQNKNGVSVTAINDKEETRLINELVKPLRRSITDIVLTTDFPLSISNREIITMKNSKWINEIEYHLPADIELGEVYG
jgi:hypothetical protein